MTGTRADLLNLERSHLGMGEQPPGSNNVPGFTDWYPCHGPGCAWCAIFQSKCLTDIGLPTHFESCRAWNLAAQNGQWPSGVWLGGADYPNVAAGDIEFFSSKSFPNGGAHVEAVELDAGAGPTVNLGGNVRDAVRRSNRSRNIPGFETYGFARPHYAPDPIAPAPSNPVPPASGYPAGSHLPLREDGALGHETWSAIQFHLNEAHAADLHGKSPIDVDGQPGPSTYSALQRLLGVGIDGLFQRISTNALRAHVGLGPGPWDAQTTVNVQHTLNGRTF